MKDELCNVISGKGKVRKGKAIQTISSYLSRSLKSSKLVKGEKHYKKKETEVLINCIDRHNLWINNIDLDNYVSEGAEQKVYLKNSKTVIKLNDGIFYESWIDYFTNLLLHNFFFPDTAYQLKGFCKNNDDLYAVVTQPFVKSDTLTKLEDVKKFLLSNSFFNTKNNDYYHPDLGIILEDLHDENVLTANGILYFIDTVFYLKKMK